MSPDPLLPVFRVCVRGLEPAMALAPVLQALPLLSPSALSGIPPPLLTLPGWLWRDTQPHAGLEGNSRFSKDTSVLLFRHWLLTLSWVDMIRDYLKSQNIVRQKVSEILQEFLQHTLKADPEREERPDILKSSLKLGGQ